MRSIPAAGTYQGLLVPTVPDDTTVALRTIIDHLPHSCATMFTQAEVVCPFCQAKQNGIVGMCERQLLVGLHLWGEHLSEALRGASSLRFTVLPASISNFFFFFFGVRTPLALPYITQPTKGPFFIAHLSTSVFCLLQARPSFGSLHVSRSPPFFVPLPFHRDFLSQQGHWKEIPIGNHHFQVLLLLVSGRVRFSSKKTPTLPSIDYWLTSWVVLGKKDPSSCRTCFFSLLPSGTPFPQQGLLKLQFFLFLFFLEREKLRCQVKLPLWCAFFWEPALIYNKETGIYQGEWKNTSSKKKTNFFDATLGVSLKWMVVCSSYSPAQTDTYVYI